MQKIKLQESSKEFMKNTSKLDEFSELDIELVDTHCHLDISPLDRDTEKIIQDAGRAGVKYMISIGIDLMSSVTACQLAAEYDQIYAAIGVHPHDAYTFNNRLADELLSISEQKKVVALGEIGLDYAKDYTARGVQQEAFDQQLDLAIQLDLPVVIHDREAHNDIINVLESKDGQARGVIHCFSGDVKFARKVLDLGFYISFTGIVTFKNADTVREVVKYCPLDRIMVETDAPFLAPVPMRGKTNQPAFVAFVAKKVAEIKGLSLEEIAKCTTQNARDLFSI